ncbi:hypothetical protein B0T25DRAFT_32633 [Lasiosphaeria hispida]|uniref:Uncharacterized protein n=1 Tax=Lasiosphaeria hispida TaxID=260671 RepID=A0AAJ0HUM2_9PEZI|nr:hypothetical protein B0T25DRAFT_32633 [Lasiosphaeria hispida]
MATVVLLGTCDTKLEELLFLRSRILENKHLQVVMIDVGRQPVSHNAITISQPQLISPYGDATTAGSELLDLPRADLIKFMSSCATAAIKHLCTTNTIHGIISAGGSGGTSLAAPVMRDAVPIGFPKMLVSTVASGDVSPYVGESDIAMLYSVVDIAGLNAVLRGVLSNAGAAIAAAALSYAARQSESETQEEGKDIRRVGITMFGVTTPAVTTIRRHLSSGTFYHPSSPTPIAFETLVFHATGSGGRAMERLIRAGELDAVLDLTTTEICDFVVPGGTMSAGPDRLSAAVEKGIPCIVSLGATDMVNFGGRGTVPERYVKEGRKLYEHNSAVTLMRTDEDEVRKVGEFVSGKLRGVEEEGRVEVWIPRGGVSVLSTAGGVFEDRKVDGVLFDTLKSGLCGTRVRVVEDERDVNDEGFAKDVAEALLRVMGLEKCGLHS